jgi:Protein of unknown function (DUF2793)
MSETPLLGLPLIASSQAQKHVTHNEALKLLDAMTFLAVADRDLTAAPTAPAEGDRYIVATGATGVWAGRGGHIAAWQDGTWTYLTPRNGWLAFIADEEQFVVRTGALWRTLPVGDTLARLGINTMPDAVNRLAISSPASLLNHEGAGHQLTINKAATVASASLLLQTAFSGRAEIGLTGDDRLHVRTSPDGAAWKDAIVIDPATANLGIGASPTDARIEVGAAQGVSGRLALVSDGGMSDVQSISYGQPGGQFHGLMARGTKDSPTQVLSGDIISGYGGRAWHSGGAFTLSSNTALHFVAAENHTSTARGAYIQFLTMKKGTAVNLERAVLADNGTFWVHDQGVYDPKLDSQTRPVADTQILASGSAEAGSASVSIGCFGYGVASMGFRGGAARGTPAAPTAVQANDFLCFMGGHGHDGANWSSGTRVLLGFKAGENWTGSAQATYITLETTAAGSTTRSERLRVTPAGDVGLGIASPTARLDVDGAVKVKSYTVAGAPGAAAQGAGATIFVSNEAGGAVLAFSDGTNWRRVTDRIVIS